SSAGRRDRKQTGMDLHHCPRGLIDAPGDLPRNLLTPIASNGSIQGTAAGSPSRPLRTLLARIGGEGLASLDDEQLLVGIQDPCRQGRGCPSKYCCAASVEFAWLRVARE